MHGIEDMGIKLGACYAKGRAGNADKRRCEAAFHFTHRKGRQVRKGNVTVTLHPSRAFRVRCQYMFFFNIVW